MAINESDVSNLKGFESSSQIVKELVNELVEIVEAADSIDQENLNKNIPEKELCTKIESLNISSPDNVQKSSKNVNNIVQNQQTSSLRAENNFYSVKWINFFHQKIPIILQNINGPCPLISICNVLLLRDQMHLAENIEVISNESLMQKLADTLFNVFVPRLQKNASDTDINIEQNINDALSIFEKLQYGIDVNVKFSGCGDFEYTKEMDIFDLFSINLYHGWLIDPQQSDLYKSLGDKSYNKLVELSINGSESDHEKTPLKLLAEDFLKTTASQLTYYGLSSLYSTLKPHELAILFRNNHFSTIYRHPDNNCLYTLVTDSGYLSHSDIIWETLDNIEGAGHFCNSNFKSIEGEEKTQVSEKKQERCQNDYLLALSLQQQEEQARQSQEQPSSARGSPRRQVTRQPSPKKKDKGCHLM